MILSYLNLLLGLLLLIVPGYMLYTYDRLAMPKAALAMAKMVVQMSVMGACLWALFRYDNVWFCLLWLVIIVVAASFLLVSRTRYRSAVLFLPVCIAMLVSVLAVSLFLIFVVLRPAASMSARWFVPISGVLTAHTLMLNIPALRTYYESLRQDGQPYLTLLGNGASRMAALAPYVTRALRSMMVPAIASLSAMGLFVMPMLLSGLLLGGLGPVDAVLIFVFLTLGCMTTCILTLGLTLILADRRSFNRQGQFLC